MSRFRHGMPARWRFRAPRHCSADSRRCGYPAFPITRSAAMVSISARPADEPLPARNAGAVALPGPHHCSADSRPCGYPASRIARSAATVSISARPADEPLPAWNAGAVALPGPRHCSADSRPCGYPEFPITRSAATVSISARPADEPLPAWNAGPQRLPGRASAAARRILAHVDILLAGSLEALWFSTVRVPAWLGGSAGSEVDNRHGSHSKPCASQP